jgi:hypothetical protein
MPRRAKEVRSWLGGGGNCALGLRVGPRLGGRNGAAHHVYENAPIRCEPGVDVWEPRPTKIPSPHAIAKPIPN